MSQGEKGSKKGGGGWLFTYPDMSPRADSASVEVQPGPLLIFRNADCGSVISMGRLHELVDLVAVLEDGKLDSGGRDEDWENLLPAYKIRTAR